MPRVSLRFHGDLVQLLTRGRRRLVAIAAPEGATVGAIIEDLGIPHTEIGEVTVDGERRPLSWKPRDGDALTVHPAGPTSASEASSPTFVLDVHLGRLARLLRLLGFDAAWSSDTSDADLAAAAAYEGRILLSRDRGLLKRREVRCGCLVRSQDSRRQLDEVVARYRLRTRMSPFSRCLVCNSILARSTDAPTGQPFAATGWCPSCGRRYWRGSHWEALAAIVEHIRGGG